MEKNSSSSWKGSVSKRSGETLYRTVQLINSVFINYVLKELNNFINFYVYFLIISETTKQNNFVCFQYFDVEQKNIIKKERRP